MKRAISATSHSFPKKSIEIGLRPNRRLKESVEDYKGLKLCNYKKKWWIYYGDVKDNPHNYSAEGRITGHFDSKKKAIEWFEHGGR